MSNIKTIIDAYDKTDDVFIGRGYEKGSVDLIKYIKTGDIYVFTSTDGAREKVANLDYEETLRDIKIALINSAIVTLEHPDYVRALVNRIPDIIVQWAELELSEEMNNSLSSTINRIFRDPYNAIQVIASLRESRSYTAPEYDKLNNHVADIIRVLEEEKEKIKTKQNDIVK